MMRRRIPWWRPILLIVPAAYIAAILTSVVIEVRGEAPPPELDFVPASHCERVQGVMQCW